MSETQALNKPKAPPLVALLFAILAVSTASIFIRYAQQEAPSLVIAAFRLVLASLILAPIALTRQRKELAGLSQRQFLLAFISGLFLALHFASWISSLEFTSVTSSVVLVNTLPLWVSLAAPIFLKERISALIWIGLAVALLGGTVVGLSQSCQVQTGQIQCVGMEGIFQGKVFTGNFLALVGAWAAAGYLIIGRRLRPTLSLISYTFLVYGSAAVVLLGTVLVVGLPFTGYSPQVYFWFLALAVVPQLLGHSTYNWALRYLSAPIVSVSLLGEPIGSSILAILILNEMPSHFEIVGGALILVGIFLVSRAETR